MFDEAEDSDEPSENNDGESGFPARFYPIFPASEWLEYLLPVGIKMVQLRLRDMPEEDMREEIRRSVDLCDSYNATLVVNDHWELAIEEEAPFVHLGQEDLDDADIHAIRSAGIRLGISTRDHLDLDRALMLEPDYITLGPIHQSKTRHGYPLGLEPIAEWKELIGHVPLCAVGGITLKRAAAVFDAGADMVAVTTDITGHDDPELRVQEWLEKTE